MVQMHISGNAPTGIQFVGTDATTRTVEQMMDYVRRSMSKAPKYMTVTLKVGPAQDHKSVSLASGKHKQHYGLSVDHFLAKVFAKEFFETGFPIVQVVVEV